MDDDSVANLIAIVGNKSVECKLLISLLTQKGYIGIIFKTISALEQYLSEKKCLAILIDIDTIPIENKGLRELTLKYPHSPFLCMSNSKYHPELKEAICYHVYACINKPVNSDELFYFLGSIRNDNQ